MPQRAHIASLSLVQTEPALKVVSGRLASNTAIISPTITPASSRSGQFVGSERVSLTDGSFRFQAPFDHPPDGRKTGWQVFKGSPNLSNSEIMLAAARDLTKRNTPSIASELAASPRFTV